MKSIQRRHPLVESLESRCMLHGCSISFSSDSYTVNEAAGTATITLVRDFEAGTVGVDFHAALGTAGSSDFTPISSQTIIWSDFQNEKTIEITIAQDGATEGNETVQLFIDNFQSTSPGSITSATLTIIDDDAGNTAPSINNFGTNIAYTENAAPKPITTTAAVVDADSANFAAGKLTVKYTSGGTANDRLEIRNNATITTNASRQILVNGNVVGTFNANGGTGTTALVVTLNNAATPQITTTILRNIVYSNVSNAPTAQRVVSAKLTDGDGGTSATVTKTINVTAVNDRPGLGGISGSVGYVRNTAAIVLAAGATVSDADSPNFATGQLQVRITGTVNASNRLAIGAGFTVNGAQVLQGATVIGTRTSNGVGTNDLIVTFNSNATKAIVQQLARSITFRTVGGGAGLRNVLFSVNDGDGGTSVERTRRVNVS